MANSDKNIRITTSKNKTTYPNIVFTGSAAGSSVITLEVLDDNTLSFTSNEGQVFSIDSNLSTGTIWAVSDISGIPLLSSSAGGTIGLGVYGGIVAIGQTNPTYKLDLKGSFGLASSNDALYNFIFSNSAVSGSNSLQIRSANSLLFFNSGNNFYTGFKSNASANVTYTLPVNDGSSGQYLSTNGSGVLSWGTPSGGSGGGSTGVGPGAQYEVAYYPGTGSSVIGNTNLKNNTATSVVSVNYTTTASDYATGAFTVSGGVGIGGSLFVGGIGASISGVTILNSAIIKGAWNGTVVGTQYGGTGQNLSSASGILTISSGTVSNSTTSSAIASALSDETGSGSLVFNTSPSFGTGITTGDSTFALLNTTANTINAFGAASTISIGAASGTATFNSTTNTTASNTGAVVFSGGVGIGKSVSIGGYLNIFNGSNYAAFRFTGTANTTYILPGNSPQSSAGTSVLSSTIDGTMSWIGFSAGGSGSVSSGTAGSFGIYANNGTTITGTSLLTFVGSGLTVGGLVNATSITDAALSVRGGLGVTGNAFIGGTASVSATTTSFGTNSGALVVSGGVGIGGTLFTNSSTTSSVSGVLHLNGSITSGTWAASAITSHYGGTGLQTPFVVGDILYATTTTTWGRLAASSTSGQVLTSNGAGALPTWQAVPPAAASSVAVAPTTVNGSFFITAVNTSSSSGLGLSTVTTFVINPSTGNVSLSGLAVTNTTATTSTTSGALTVAGGAGIANSAFIGGMLRVGSNSFSKSYSLGDVALDNGSTVDTPAITYYWGNNINFGTDVYSDGVGSTRYRIVYNLNESGGREVYTVDTNGNVRLYNSGGGNYFGFKFSGSASTTYTLPGSTPAGTAVSVLQSDQAGVMSWVPMSTGGGSGSVSSGTAGSFAIYATNGTTVSGTSILTFVGSGLTVGGLVNATSTTDAALSVRGGLGVTGNAFIGGTASVSSTTASFGTNSGALVISGGVGIGGTLFTNASSTSSVSGVLLSNGIITSGTWSGNLITTLYGGTGFNSYTIGDILYAATATSIGKLPAGTLNYVLTSNGPGALPTWQAVPSSSATSVATATNNNDSVFYPTFVGTATASGQGLTTDTDYNYNPGRNLLSVVNISGTAATFSLYTNTIQMNTGNNININDSAGTTIASFNTSNGWLRSAQTTESTSTTTGALVSAGGLGIAKNAFIGGTASITSAAVSYGTNSGALVVSGGVGIGGTLFTNSTLTSSISGVLHLNSSITSGSWTATPIAPQYGGTGLNNVSATGLLQYSSGTASVITTSAALATIISDETGTAGKLVFSTSPTFSTSVITDSSSFDVFNTTATTVNAFGAGTAITIGAATGTLTLNNAINLLNQTTASTLPSSGALVVLGGVGIGRTLSVGGSLNVFSATSNYAGFRYTGTANTTYTLPPNSPQAATGASVLSSAIDGTMTWVGMSAGGSGSPGGSNTQIQYNNSGSFGGATGLTWNNSSNLLTVSATSTLVTSTEVGLRIINDNYTNAGTNIRWSPAFELIGRAASQGPGFATTFNTRFTTEVVPMGPANPGAYLRTKYSFDLVTASPSYTNDIFRIHSLYGVGIGASNSTSNAISYFRVNTSQSGDITYILPSGLPSTGTSVLQSDTSGNLSWIQMGGGSSGSGNGTVAIPGAQYQIAGYYWSAVGASVSGSSTLTNNTSTGVVNISHTTPSTSTSTGALTVAGSVGIAGSAYIGGQINQTFTPSVGAGIDHAVFLQSNPIATTIGALIQIGSANKWDGTTAGYFTGFPGGTFIGVNAAAGNTADLINFQENGITSFSVGAGGTDVQFGQAMDYPVPNLLASFKSSVDTYNQLIVQNKSSGTQASANIIINNNASTDTTFYGEFGMNSSNFSGTGALGTPNAVYLASASGPLVLGTTTAHPIRFTVNGGASDMLYISESGLAISCFANFGLRSASDLRFWNSGNTFYAGIQGGNTVSSYLLSMPTGQVGAGASALITGSDGQMYFVAPGGGIAFSSVSGNLPALRAKRSYNLVFCTGYTPAAVGVDTAILRIPESPSDGTTVLTYNLRRFQVRVETPSAGTSRLQLERSSTDTGAFTLAASGSSHIAGFGVTLTGAGIYLTSVTSFAGSLVTSGNLMRLNWTLLNATHANFSINLLIEEV